MQDWRAAYLHEISLAQAARAAGKEGKARVCTRRAAGILIGAFLEQQGLSESSPSAHARLRNLVALPGISSAIQDLVDRLLMRVDENFSLPAGIDLLSDAQQLGRELGLVE
jgi:hypothetical protein